MRRPYGRWIAVLILLAGWAGGPAFAVGADPATDVLRDSNYRQARALIDDKRFADAIPLLMTLRTLHPDSPHVANWLGYAHRKLKNYPISKSFYDEALRLDPAFLPALEYQGEWFIETGDIASAEANLARLIALCAGCEETQDLREALAKAKAAR